MAQSYDELLMMQSEGSPKTKVKVGARVRTSPHGDVCAHGPPARLEFALGARLTLRNLLGEAGDEFDHGHHSHASGSFWDHASPQEVSLCPVPLLW